MAIVTVPFTAISLVEHIGGGAILHAGGGYVAGTLIPAPVISAFSAATALLGNVSGSAMALATSPYVAAPAAIAVAAAGAYCYFYGIPAPVEAALVKAGLAAPAKGGLAIPVAKLATALVVLGAAGLLLFNIYKRVWQARGALGPDVDPDAARRASEAAFGTEFWKKYGEAIWRGVTDTVDQVTDTVDQIWGWVSSAASGARKAGATLLPPAEAVVDGVGGAVTAAGIYGGAVAGSAYAASTVTVLGSSTLGGVGLSLGLVSAPVWPVVAGAVGAGALALTGWKLARSYLKGSA